MIWLTKWNTLLWQWMLPVLLTGTAVICGIRQRGRPVRGFHRVLRETFGSLLSDRKNLQQRRIFASALAATMGTGNLVGTALALMTGGAGAIFWMWISALLGMFLVYAENLLGMRYRRRLPDGTVIGGAPAYLRYGLKSSLLAGFFSLCCAVSALGMGVMAQSNTIARTAAGFGIPVPITGLLTAAVLFVILCGGTKRIGNTAVWLMPLLCGLYLLGCAVLLVLHRAALPDAFRLIFREAFGLRAAGGGITASLLMHSLSVGLRRGIFSNEAGLGSSALLHVEADTKDSASQGKWAAAEVFADTVVCCTATALVILTAPGCKPAAAHDPSALLLHAFSGGLGSLAGGFLAVCMVLLAFATMIGWYPCGAAAVRYLFGRGAEPVFLAGYVLLAFAGALGDPGWVFAFCDCCNGLMALPNLCALLVLCERGE